MNVLMYHYVRPAPVDLPYFRYLHEDDFARQIDLLVQQSRILTAAEFLDILRGAPVPEDAFLLTFDDGLRDHYDNVLPILEARRLTGLFFVLTDPPTGGRMLDVHAIHHLLGQHGGPTVLDTLEKRLTPSMIDESKKALFDRSVYRNQTNDSATQSVKKILNYFVAEAHRGDLIAEVQSALGAPPGIGGDSLYLSEVQMRDMHERGHLVASHGATHRVLRTLSESEQRDEICGSFEWLDGALRDRAHRVFCYPYGGPDTYDSRTIAVLEALDCRAAFAVDPRPLHEADLRTRPMALPRFDCNMFPFGAASLGSRRAAGMQLQ
jgi:peptidoglycan/xylan/chitin deacetylase (PgdA/CDA1 family)